ncbi:hypothetical protein VTO73DRAFT_10945 [Trametes versicolor]
MYANSFAELLAGRSTSASIIEELLKDIEWIHLKMALSVVVSVVVCYEHVLTLGREINYIWMGRFSGATLLFYVIRYAGLFGAALVCGNALISSGVVQTPSTRYAKLATVDMTLIGLSAGLLIPIGAAVFAGLRAYAISGRNKWVLTIVLVLGLVNPTAYILEPVRTISSKFYVPILAADECAVSPGITLARVCAVVADIAVLVVTWRYMRPAIVIPGASQVDLPRANGNAIGSLANVLVKDGTIYFVALLIINVAALGLSRVHELTSALVTWTSGLICVLNSRFILDLQEASAPPDSIETSMGASSPRFTVPGSAPLSFRGRRSQTAPAECHELEDTQRIPASNSVEV